MAYYQQRDLARRQRLQLDPHHHRQRHDPLMDQSAAETHSALPHESHSFRSQALSGRRRQDADPAGHHGRPRCRRAGSRSGHLRGLLDVTRYRGILKARTRRRRRRWPGIRCSLLREKRYAQDQARRVQAELHPDPQRSRLHSTYGESMSPQDSTAGSSPTRYYGKYRGLAINNIDPLQIGRGHGAVRRRSRRNSQQLGSSVRPRRRHSGRHVHHSTHRLAGLGGV
jgi:hypothetical protein